MKIFGREPAMWLALVGALVSMLGAFVFHFTTDQQGALNGGAALVLGLITAWVTRNGLPAAILGAVKGVFYVALAWHFNIPADRQAIILTAVSALVAMFVRTQVVAPVAPDAAVAARGTARIVRE